MPLAQQKEGLHALSFSSYFFYQRWTACYLSFLLFFLIKQRYIAYLPKFWQPKRWLEDRVEFFDLINSVLIFFIYKYLYSLNKLIYQSKISLNQFKNKKSNKFFSLNFNLFFLARRRQQKHFNETILIKWNLITLKTIFFIVGMWSANYFLSSTSLPTTFFQI